jgi:hypothetical protein
LLLFKRLFLFHRAALLAKAWSAGSYLQFAPAK